MNPRIILLRKKRAQLHKELFDIDQQIRDLQLKEWDLEEGCIVYSEKYDLYIRAQEILFWTDEGKPWISGPFRKKNGDWSKVHRHLFRNWKVMK